MIGESHKEGVHEMSAKVLIIDDEAAIRESLAMLFELEGYDVKTAGNGEEALAIAQKEPVDAMVSDLRMPVCDGLCLLDKLQARGDATPVIMITGFADQDAECLSRGAKAVFRKPFEADALMQAVKRAM